MNKIKQKICEKMSNLYDNLIGVSVNNFEMAMVNGDSEGIEYWDSRVADYLAKKEKWDSKLQ